MTQTAIPQDHPTLSAAGARATLGVAISLALAIVPGAAMADPATITEAAVARLARADTPAGARRSLARIGHAAERACGAAPFSLREVRATVRASACWHDAVRDTVRRLDKPALTRAFSDAPSTRWIETAAACSEDQPCPTLSN